MALFLEGVDAVAQPCTLPLLVFSVAFVVAAAREAPIAAVAFLGGAAVMAWARFAGVTTLDLAEDHFLVGGGLVVAAATLTGLAPEGVQRRPLVASGSFVGGALAAALWRPCVGASLGALLNDAPQRGIASLPSFALYILGAGLLVVAVGLLPIAVAPLGRLVDRRAVSLAGVVIGIGLGVVLALGWWGGVVDELVRLSSA